MRGSVVSESKCLVAGELADSRWSRSHSRVAQPYGLRYYVCVKPVLIRQQVQKDSKAFLEQVQEDFRPPNH